MKKVLLSISVLVVLIFSGLYYWQAEHRVGPPIKNVNLVSFDVTGLSLPVEYISLKDRVAELHGVTACAVNAESKIASVTFYPDQLNIAELKSKIAVLGNCKVNIHTFAELPGCPVDTWRSKVHSFFSFIN